MTFEYESPPPRELLERYGVPEDVIDGVLCMHAHELAEKVREHGGTRGDEFFAEALQAAADLIDPEAGGS